MSPLAVYAGCRETMERKEEKWLEWSRGGMRYVPLLNLVEALEKRNRDEDDNGLSAVADLNLQEESWCQPPCFAMLADSQCPTPLPISFYTFGKDRPEPFSVHSYNRKP